MEALSKARGGIDKPKLWAGMGKAHRGQRRCVLIADDARSVAIRLAALIEETGQFEVVGPVYDGVAAQKSFEECWPDAVILDFAMPLLSGLEVVQAIRKLSSACFIIVLTNQSDPSLRQRCLAAGANEYLRKSQDFEAVPGILASHFEQFP